MLPLHEWLLTKSGIFIISIIVAAVLYFLYAFIHHIAERNNVSRTTVMKVFLIIGIGVIASFLFAPILFTFGVYKSAKSEWRKGMDNFHNKKGIK